jgi:CelD/BcsL family acetyltransferase involved in cellulose biosynthesis
MQPTPLRVISSPTLGEHATAWDELVLAGRMPSPFLRSWWLEAVQTPDAVFVLVVRKDELVGGLALNATTKRGITRIQLLQSGALWPHGLDVVARTGEELAVAHAVLGHVAKWGQLGALVDVTGTFAESALVGAAPSRQRVERMDEWMTLTVPKDFETYLANRPRHLRQEIRRIDRRLTERGVIYRTVTDRAGIEASLDEFERLHRLRWRNGGSGFVSSISTFATAARAGAARGEVVIHEVAVGERVLASLVTLELGTRCWFYQMGRDDDPEWSGTGVLVRARAIQRSCEVRHTTVDLGTGSPELKVQWIDERRPVMRVTWGHRMGRVVFGWRAIKGPFVTALRTLMRAMRAGRAALKSTGATRGGALLGLRVADVRFLLPTSPRTVHVFGHAEWVEVLDRAGITAAPAGATPDWVVTHPSHLRAALDVGAPMILVTGWTKLSVLKRAGYTCQRFMVRGGSARPRLILPAGRRCLARVALVERSRLSIVRRNRNRIVAALLARGITWGEGSRVVATRGARDLPLLCDTGLRTAGVDADGARWYLDLGEGDDLQRATFHVGLQPSSVDWVVKFGRLPHTETRFEAEARGLHLAARVGGSIAEHAPRLLGRTSVDGLPVSVETAARGSSLFLFLRSLGAEAASRRIDEVAAWIIELGHRTATPPAQLEPERQRLEHEVLGAWRDSGAPPDLVARVPPVSGVMQHNDLGTWNVIGDARGWTVLDWEDARETGLPLWDLLYFLTDALVVVPSAATGFDTPSETLALLRGERPTSSILFSWIRRAVTELAIPAEGVGPIATLCWLHHSRSHVERRATLANASGGIPLSIPDVERIAGEWLTDPKLGADWDTWR